MRHTSKTGSFIVICFINMLLNFRWSIPAWILLAAYFLFGFPPLWVFFIALAFWPLGAISMTLIMRLLRRLCYPSRGYYTGSGSKVVRTDSNAPSANPYSVTQEKEQKIKEQHETMYDLSCCLANHPECTPGTTDTGNASDSSTVQSAAETNWVPVRSVDADTDCNDNAGQKSVFE